MKINLLDVTGIKRGVRVVRAQLSESEGYPVYQNSLIPLGYYENSNCEGNTAFVIGAGAAGEVGYSKDNFWAADDCYYFTCSDKLNAHYLYHFLLTQQQYLLSQVRKASVPRLSRMVFEKIIIPLPSLKEQERIVSILDRFDRLCNDLSEGLPAEIEARKKQYEFYRDKLLTFSKKES